jgi:hypothetical protein
MGLIKAKLTPMDAATPARPVNDEAIEVHFNPTSLALTYAASGANGGKDASGSADLQNLALQRTTFSSNLRFDLLFDTSETGADVRNTTLKIAALLRPRPGRSPIVQFSWGTFVFYGALSSLSEALDFFSDQGVPLRSSLQLAMSGVELDGNPAAGSGLGAGFSAGASAGFSAGASAGFSAGASAGFSAGASIGTTPLTLAQSGDSVQGLAARAGVDWKAVASANGIDNPRQLQAGAVINLNASAQAGTKIG